MPLGNDPTPVTELEQSFGVTSSAEELIKANQARMPEEQRAGGLKAVNEPLNSHVRDRLGELEDHVGFEVADFNVRGTGSNALIHYTYVGPRDAHEKGYVPFADVFGDKLLKRRREESVALRTDPEEAAQAAVAKVVADADADAQAKLRAAQEEAQQIIDKAREQADKAIRDARAEGERVRASIAEEAQKAAESAREQAEQDRADADKAVAKRAAKAAAKPPAS